MPQTSGTENPPISLDKQVGWQSVIPETMASLALTSAAAWSLEGCRSLWTIYLCINVYGIFDDEK